MHPQSVGNLLLGGTPKCGDPHPMGHPIEHPKSEDPHPRDAPMCPPKMGTPILWDAPMRPKLWAPQSYGTPQSNPQKMGTPPSCWTPLCPPKMPLSCLPPAVPLHFRAPFGDPRPPLTSVPRVSDPHTWAAVVSPLLCAPQQLLPHIGAFFSVASTAPPPPPQRRWVRGGRGVGSDRELWVDPNQYGVGGKGADGMG